MDIAISYFVSVMAGITSFYLCKWLDRKNKDNQ